MRELAGQDDLAANLLWRVNLWTSHNRLTWELHFNASERYNAGSETDELPRTYNLRMEPFESYDSTMLRAS